MYADIQFTARKRDAETGERWRWRWGPYRDLDAVEEALERARRLDARVARVEVVVRGARVDDGVSHAERTREGMARARARGRPVGRPRRSFEVIRAWHRVEDLAVSLGKTRALVLVAYELGVSLATLKRAIRPLAKRGSKGVRRTSKPKERES